jgi:aminoglycoside phosphotransferase (APT) family kinase protein
VIRESAAAPAVPATGTYAKERDLPALAQALTTWLEPRVGGPTEVAGLSYPTGAGISNETIFFDAIWSDEDGRHEKSLVLRIHPDKFQIFLEPDFDLQVQILRTLAGGGHVTVPNVRWFEQDDSVLGRPFFVMDRMLGRVPVSNPNYNAIGWLHDAEPAQRRHLWRAAMEQLCRIAEVPVESVSFLHKPHWGKSGLEQQFAYWESSLGWACGNEPPAVLVDALERLRDTFPENTDDALSWGDARIGNMMFDAEFNVLGVMDWEGVSLGGAVQDLAWWLVIDDIYSRGSGYPLLEGMGSREETIDFWEDRLRRDADYLAWHEAFVAFKTSILSSRIQEASKGTSLDVPMNKRSAVHPRMVELLEVDLTTKRTR